MAGKWDHVEERVFRVKDAELTALVAADRAELAAKSDRAG